MLEILDEWYKQEPNAELEERIVELALLDGRLAIREHVLLYAGTDLTLGKRCWYRKLLMPFWEGKKDFTRDWSEIFHIWSLLDYPEEWRPFANFADTDKEMEQQPALFQEYCRELYKKA